VKIFVIIGLILFFCLSSCSDKLNSLDDTAIEVTSVNGEEISFSKKLTNNSDIFNIASSGLGDIRYLDIRVSRDGVLLGKLSDELDGVIYKTMKTDLNNNSKPEILLLLLPNVTENKLLITGYEFDGKVFKRFDLPDLSEDLYFGYQGKDHIYVSKSKLVREFPINIADGNPGKKRRIFYKLNKELNFILDNHEDFR